MLVLSNSLDSRRLVEVRRADRLPANTNAESAHAQPRSKEGTVPDDVPVRTARNDVESLVLHDVEQLGPNFARLAKRFRVKEVLRRPIVSVPAPTVSSIRTSCSESTHPALDRKSVV